MDDDKQISAISSEQIDTIKLNDLFTDTITIDTTGINSIAGSSGQYLYSTGNSNYSYGNLTINTAAGINGTWGAVGSSLTSSPSGLHVTSDAEFEGDVKIKGVSILETLNKIEKRLSILRPDPEKLAHFESLKKAYEHYKTLEALCELPTKEEE
jgi:hypothetical protein